MFAVFSNSLPPAVMRTLLRQMDIGSVTCGQMWVHAVHTKGVGVGGGGGEGGGQGGGGGRHEQVCTMFNSGG